MKKYQVKLIAFFCLILILVPKIARGNVIENIVEKAFAKFFFWLGQLVARVGTLIFAFAAFLTKIALEFNFRILDLQPRAGNALVSVGWSIVRDVANLGFVIAIVVIAIATILRFEQYGVKKLLPRLIAAAILVNFSLVIAGVFIDFSHILTAFFFDKISGERGFYGAVSGLADAFDPQKLFQVSNPTETDDDGIVQVIMEGIANLLFITTFILAASFALGAIALMFFARYLWLSFLLIVAPIVWLFWVIPALTSQFSKWWNKFLKWVFFAPATSFFIYLALQSIEGVAQFKENAIGGQTADIVGGQGDFLNIVSQGAQMIVIVGILIGGLITAENMGITGARAAVALAGKAGGAVKGWASRKAMQMGSYPLRTVVGRKATEQLQTMGQKMGLLGRAFTWPMRQLGKGLSDLRERSEESLTAGIASKVNNRSIEENARRWAAANNAEKAEIIKFLLNASSSKDRATRTAAEKALASLPERALSRNVRLSFLYGGGGAAGEPYGAFGMRPERDMTETFAKKGRTERIEEMIEELAKEEAKKMRKKQRGGGPAKESKKPKP